MGRTRSFDETDAARAALGVFWDRGFEATAVPELEEATGLSRSSIYHSFGSKRGLFDAAVDAYLTEVVRPRLAPLQTDNVAPGALVDYLTGLRAAMADPALPLASNGCLLLNTATTSVADDETARAVVRAYRLELSSAIAKGMAAAHPDLDAAASQRTASACTAYVIAAMTVVRVDPDAALSYLDDAIGLAAEAASHAN
ncbi:MAG: TetR/AcrR family transcriptional regulator [Microbacterium sp.]|uniref:TetR/AcrR family transcriptional regulator n=1 Tax=Microbacterium sp. TaxID=51671 RepID=UPI001AC8EB78|nr:TetR/AcrR family transcriptional regulator [Microbacterium sp.]MBN9176998.1 TetR/AcrR family transcriptional regulator [Microbacterium sp.]